MTPAKAPADTRAFVYRYQDGLYVNLTNRCPTACAFCIKFTWKMKYRGYDLKLGGAEPKLEELLEAVASARRERPFSEVVFCGYGESTYRLADMLSLCGEFARRYPGTRRRLNTVGLGNLINRRSIAADLATGLDAVSVSLNSSDPKQWAETMRPLPEFAARGFESVLEFVRECAKAVPDTTVTAVQLPGVDLAALERLALSLGARWRERPYLDEYQAT